jgi:hypothetical protein
MPDIQKRMASMKPNLHQRAMLAEMVVLQRRVAKGDEVVIYFAGHAVQIGIDAVVLPTDITYSSGQRTKRDVFRVLDASRTR